MTSRLLPILAALALFAIGGLALAHGSDTGTDPASGPRAVATVQAIEAAAESAQLAHTRAIAQEAMLSWLWFAAQAAVIVTGAALVVFLLWNFQTHLARRMRLAERRLGLLADLAETRSGTVSPREDLRPLSPAIVDLSMPTDAPALEPAAGTFQLNVPGSAPVTVAKLPADRPADVKLALRVLRLSMQRNGAQSNRLAGWRELALSADTWQRAIETMRPAIVTRAGRGGGTFVTGGRTLHSLYADLSRGRPGA